MKPIPKVKPIRVEQTELERFADQQIKTLKKNSTVKTSSNGNGHVVDDLLDLNFFKLKADEVELVKKMLDASYVAEGDS